MKKHLAVFIFLSFKLFGQLSPEEIKIVDSLKKIIFSEVKDTTKVEAYHNWDDIIYISDPSLDKELNKKIIAISESNLKKSSLSTRERELFKISLRGALNNLGIILKRQGELGKAIDAYSQCLKLYVEAKNKRGMAGCYINISLVYLEQGKIANAIDYQTLGLKLVEELGDTLAIASALGNIGFIYYDQLNDVKAIEYFTRSLKAFEQVKNKNGIATQFDNLGNIYNRKKMHDIAMEYYSRSFKLMSEIGNKKGASNSLNNIGTIYYNKHMAEKAKEYYLRSLKIQEEISDKIGVSLSLCNLSLVYYDLNDLPNAILCGKKALDVAKEAQGVVQIRDASKSLYNSYKKTNSFKEALEMHELYIALRDSILSEESQKEVLKQELKHTYEKQKAIDEKEHEKQIAVSEQQAHAQKIISWAVALGLILVLIFTAFIVKRLNITRKQKHLIENQKHLIEEKHKEITDSINYAERIQRSFIATKEILDENLNDYFVLFKPKDVVSGDFYWAGKLNNGNFALVTADSTGHGVPGAIMSLLNITSLEKAIETSTEPSDILNLTRKTIIERLKKDGSEHGGKDGMDASLTVYDFKNKKLIVAGANNPVWIVRGTEVVDIKPDKMPVGKHDKDTVSFTQQEIDLQSGDVVYTLTDGYPDQFGGEKRKKFMSKNLKKLLVSNSHLPMREQKQILEKTFADWVGSLEQVDDVTLIGVRV